MHYNGVSRILAMHLLLKPRVAITVGFFTLVAIVYGIAISANPIRVTQKCEKRVINGENVIVCCDKDGKNCART
jgi:hypothetical protein